MKKGMLTTLSALPAEDTENHHHKKKEGRGSPPCPVPQGSNRLLDSLLKHLWGKSHDVFYGFRRVLIHRVNPSTSKIRTITSGVLKLTNLKLFFQLKDTEKILGDWTRDDSNFKCLHLYENIHKEVKPL